MVYTADNKIKKAFTLAEVLITLGIIGVVAAMTIPTLMNNIADAQYKTALKKSFTILNQAYLSAKNDNGGSIKNLCASNDSTCLANIFKPYLRYSNEVDGAPNAGGLPNCWDNSVEILNISEPHVCLALNDGMNVVFDMEWSDCNYLCGWLSLDINGLKKPNKWGKDRYILGIYDNVIKADETDGTNTCQDGQGTWLSNLYCAFKYMYK